MKRGFTLIELLVVIAIIAILAAILFPVFSKAREKARQVQCINNQKQIATAVLMYVQENEETLPPSKTFWTDIDVPAKVKRCPTAGEKIANAYVFNNSLSELSLGDVRDAVGTMLTVDGQHDQTLTSDPPTYNNIAYTEADLNFRHNSALVVAYVDGHVSLDTAVPFTIEGWDKDPSSYPWWLLWGSNAPTSTNYVMDSSNPYQGNNCVDISYNFNGGEYGFQIQRQTAYILPPVEVRLAIQGDTTHTNICVRFGDSTGEVLQYFLSPVDSSASSKDWRIFSAKLSDTTNDHFWGDNDGVLDYPCTFQNIIMYPWPDQPQTGHLRFDSLTMVFEARHKK